VEEGDDEKAGGFYGGTGRDKVSLHYTENPLKVKNGDYPTKRTSELGIFR
jgi:hypothetical protein